MSSGHAGCGVFVVLAQIGFVSDVWAWWSWEVSRTDRAVRAHARSAARVHVTRDGVQVRAPDGEPLTDTIDPRAIGAVIRDLRKVRRIGRGPVDIVLGHDRTLRRDLGDLRLPRSRMRAMAKLDYRTAVPARHDDAALVLPAYGDTPGAAYFVIRRGHVAPVIDGLRGAGLPIGRILCDTDEGEVPLDAASRRTFVRPSPVRRALRALIRGATVTAGLLVAVLIGATHVRYATEIAQVEADLAAAQRALADTRQGLAEAETAATAAAAVRADRASSVPLVRVLDDLAGVLPDGTWLAELDLHAGGVTISGTSPAAADLLPLIEAAPHFRAPAFTHPVVRDPADGLERFIIAFEVEAAHG